MKYLLAGIALLLLFCGCKDKLEDKIIKAYETRENKLNDTLALDLKSVTWFAWDEFYKFRGIPTTESMSKSMGVQYNNASTSGNSDIVQFVFLLHKKVVYDEINDATTLPIGIISSCDSIQPYTCFRAESAKFLVVKEINSWDHKKNYYCLYEMKK